MSSKTYNLLHILREETAEIHKSLHHHPLVVSALADGANQEHFIFWLKTHATVMTQLLQAINVQSQGKYLKSLEKSKNVSNPGILSCFPNHSFLDHPDYSLIYEYTYLGSAKGGMVMLNFAQKKKINGNFDYLYLLMEDAKKWDPFTANLQKYRLSIDIESFRNETKALWQYFLKTYNHATDKYSPLSQNLLKLNL